MTLIRRPGIAVITLLFILVGAAFLTQVVPYRQILDSRHQVSGAEQRLSDLESENASLQADANALNTDEEIEKLARDKLGYVRPGEIAYVVLEPPGGDQPAQPAEVATADPPRTWVDRVWDFLTGRDLETSG
ncbi:MAG: septum formation initiator family protein [Acidimicrobiia bacterium]